MRLFIPVKLFTKRVEQKNDTDPNQVNHSKVKAITFHVGFKSDPGREDQFFPAKTGYLCKNHGDDMNQVKM